MQWTAHLLQRYGQPVLARIAAELPQHEGGRDRSLPNIRGQAQDFIPMGADVFSVDRAAHERRQRRIIALFPWDKQALVGQVTDARREPEAQQVHQGEHMIRKAGRVGVMLLDAKKLIFAPV